MTKDFDNLGEPDLKLAGFQLWVHSRQFPQEEDYWDGNWVNVTAHCAGKGASVWVRGAIIHLPRESVRAGGQRSWTDCKAACPHSQQIYLGKDPTSSCFDNCGQVLKDCYRTCE
jgi:hypothetical protein